MSALSFLVIGLLVGCCIGIVTSAMMVLAKDRKPEAEGAAEFAFKVMDRIADEEAKNYADWRGLSNDLKQLCAEAIERVGIEENNFRVDSTNG